LTRELSISGLELGQPPPQTVMLSARELWVGVDDIECGITSNSQKFHIAIDVGDSEVRHAMLTGPEDIALATQSQVLLGDHEAVVLAGQYPNSLASRLTRARG
jgi:hypothetical protein